MDKMSLADYMSALDTRAKGQFKRVQTEVMIQCPEAELVMSYGMPTFKYKGKVIIHFGAFSDHMSLFPGAGTVEELADKLADFKTSKGTIQFTQKQPVSDELLSEIVSISVARARS